MDSARAVPILLALGLALTVSVVGPAAAVDTQGSACAGTIASPANGTTVVSIQGVRFTADGPEKTPALLVGVDPHGGIEWIHNASANGRWWVYDVDPLPDGDLLLAATEPGRTVVEVIDPQTREHVSVTRFDGVTDAHDVDLVSGEFLLVDKGEGHERVLAYNRSRKRVVWEWRFANHFDDAGGGPPNDWTHVNDIDALGDGRYLVSVRNFDQVIVVNRETGAIDLRLGRDDAHDVLNEQHNPQFLRSDRGRPTILVADSENDRVVEYVRENGSWTRTWELSGGGLSEPRDADRLPGGNTLVVDRKGHRVLEVTPDGQVVWEFYAPWQPYDAERMALGDEPGGPTIRDQGATGAYTLSGSAGFEVDAIETCADALTGGDAAGRMSGEDLERIAPAPSELWWSLLVAGVVVLIILAGRAAHRH